MNFTFDHAKPALLDAGFAYDSGPATAPGQIQLSYPGEFTMATSNPRWTIGATLFGLMDEYSHVEIGLVHAGGGADGFIGPHHRVLAPDDVARHLPAIRTVLEVFVRDESLLRCPECGLRWLVLKEPDPGKTWPPFLSCTGMHKVRTSFDGVRGKGIVCHGARNDIPALVLYP